MFARFKAKKTKNSLPLITQHELLMIETNLFWFNQNYHTLSGDFVLRREKFASKNKKKLCTKEIEGEKKNSRQSNRIQVRCNPKHKVHLRLVSVSSWRLIPDRKKIRPNRGLDERKTNMDGNQ